MTQIDLLKRIYEHLLCQDYEAVNAEVRSWAEDEKFDLHYAGICAFLGRINSGLLKEFYECLETWPLFTGDEGYPVPHPEHEPEEDFMSASQSEMWTGPYGEARLDLLKHFINYLEAKNGPAA